MRFEELTRVDPGTRGIKGGGLWQGRQGRGRVDPGTRGITRRIMAGTSRTGEGRSLILKISTKEMKCERCFFRSSDWGTIPPTPPPPKKKLPNTPLPLANTRTIIKLLQPGQGCKNISIAYCNLCKFFIYFPLYFSLYPSLLKSPCPL